MAVKFVAGITAWSANAATATSAAFTPATGETLLICGESFVAAAGVITGSQGVFTVDVAQANTSGGGANGSNSTGHLLFAKGVSQTVTIASAGGTFEAGFGIRYSGVAAVQKATCTLVAAPGTGANAIVGQPVVVPAGAILIVACIDISNGPTTITSSNANASRFAVTTGNGVFNFFEFNGNGTTITPLCTTTTAADDYFMAQWLLIPAFAPSVVKKPVLFQKPFRLGFKGVVLDATPPPQASGTAITITGIGDSTASYPVTATGELDLFGVSNSTAVLSFGASAPLNLTASSASSATFSLTGVGALQLVASSPSSATYSLSGTGALSLTGSSASAAYFQAVANAGNPIALYGSSASAGFVSLTASGALAFNGSSASAARLSLTGSGALGITGVSSSSGYLNLGFTSGASVSFYGSSLTAGIVSLSATGALSFQGSSATSGAVNLTGLASAQITGASSSSAFFNLTGLLPGSIFIAGVAPSAATFDLGSIGGGTQPAGRHRKRYAVVDGWRLLVFDSKKLADEAKAAILARINPPTKNQRRKLKVRVPTPDLVIDLHHVQASAGKIGQTNEFVELQGKQDAQSLLKLHEDIQAQDDEDVALSVAHVLADEDAQHAHLLKVIAMTTLLQRALRKT